MHAHKHMHLRPYTKVREHACVHTHLHELWLVLLCVHAGRPLLAFIIRRA